jgi:signal transduction histidine kinase
MIHEPSLRARVLVGAVLWTLGLLLVASALLAAAIESHGEGAAVIHGALAHTGVVVSVSVICLALGAWQVRAGLASVLRLRRRLASVQAGEAPLVGGTYPAEIQPLVDGLNALIDDRERRVQRAQAKAGDLAHGLKTPLAVLAQEADRAAREGHVELASSLGEQVARMRHQIDYHLAHARAAASGASLGGGRSPVGTAAAALAQTLARIHAERHVAIDLRIAPGHAVRCEREDLDEMLGNLMDNACKWARSQVTVSSTHDGTAVAIVVADDGAGLDPAMRSHVLRRGVRLDERVPGSGLGLAITRDLAEIYGGSLALDQSAGGGLAARLTLPSAQAAGL